MLGCRATRRIYRPRHLLRPQHAPGADPSVSDPIVRTIDQVPSLDGGLALAVIVHRAHEDGIDSVLGEGTAAHLTRGDLEQALIYCAERRCERDNAVCPGCRLQSERAGIATLDDYCARYGTINALTSGLTISGGRGSDVQSVSSLDYLARAFMGEEYWYWARRVLRKVRYGLRTSDDLFDPAFAAGNGPAVILMEPQIAENVGMVARAMAKAPMQIRSWMRRDALDVQDFRR